MYENDTKPEAGTWAAILWLSCWWQCLDSNRRPWGMGSISINEAVILNRLRNA